MKKRAKETQDVDERDFLTNYLKAVDDLSDAKKTVKETYGAAEKTLTKQLEENPDDESLAELCVIGKYLRMTDQISDLKKQIKTAEAELDTVTYEKYPELTEDEVRKLVVDEKWLATLDAAIHGELDRISQSLTGRVKELAERYDTPLPELSEQVAELEEKVGGHLERMGFVSEDSLLVEATQ